MPKGVAAVSVPKKRRWLRLFLFGFAILFAVAAGAAVTTAFFAKHEFDKLVTPKSPEIAAAQKSLSAPLPGQPANILILGSDHRRSLPGDGQRSDTMLLVRLNPKQHTVSMLSFPRDLYVEIPGHGQAKINDAYSYGGPKLSVDTIKSLTGMEVNFIVNVDFRGFRQIIDTLGGVYMDVDQRYHHDNDEGGERYAEIDLEPGYQLLKGRDALSFARFRHSDSDFYRIARQQLMLDAMKQQIGASRVANNLPGLYKVLYKNTDIGTGGNGKVGFRTIISYLRLALALKGNSVYHFEVNGGIGTAGNGASIVEYDPSAVKEVVASFLNPDAKAQANALDEITGSASTTKTTTTPVNKNVQVHIQNGNGVGGSAQTAAEPLKTAGYNVLIDGNADNPNHATTNVYYRRDADKSMADAIADLFDNPTVGKFTPTVGEKPGTRILIIVGRTGLPKTTATSSTGETVPVQKASITTDRQYAFDAFAEIRGKTKVPLLYPTVRELNSTFEFPVRAYKIGVGREVYDAVRLVGKTGSGDFWGYQGTMWPNPPLLEHPTKSVTYDGISYSLYMDGAKIHMISWHQGGGTFWITNTLLNKLNNPTLLAIARGVKPLGRVR